MSVSNRDDALRLVFGEEFDPETMPDDAIVADCCNLRTVVQNALITCNLTITVNNPKTFTIKDLIDQILCS